MSNASQFIALIDGSKIAGEAIARGQGVIVTGGEAVLSADAGVSIYGVAKNDAAQGEPVQIVRLGLAPVKIGVAAGLTAGKQLMVQAATGNFIAVTAENTTQTSLDAAEALPPANGDVALAFINVFAPTEIPA